MFARLFGETEEDQIRSLKVKAIISAVVLVITFLGYLLTSVTSGSIEVFRSMAQGGIGLTAILCIVWGWRATLNLIGYGSIGALFSGNVAVGVIILFAAFLLGCFIGFFVMLIGTLRYIYLVVKRHVSSRAV